VHALVTGEFDCFDHTVRMTEYFTNIVLLIYTIVLCFVCFCKQLFRGCQTISPTLFSSVYRTSALTFLRFILVTITTASCVR
jgi:hypothetical protein